MRAILLAAACICLVQPTLAQEEREKGDREKDDPRARQQYLEELRGADTGIPPGARLKALHEMDEMIRQEGARYWRERGVVLGMEQSGEGVTSNATAAATDGSGSIAGFTPSSGQWLFIGPRPTNGGIMSSGRTAAIVVDPRDATGNTAYIGGAQGGIWKTTDGGTNWTPLTDQQPSLATGSMAIDGSTNPSTVYVGTGEQGFAFDSYYGAGVLKSDDGGTTWTQLGADKFAGPIASCAGSGSTCGGAFIGGLSVRPGITVGNPAHILAAVSLPSGFTNGPGVYRTTDGGSTWTNVLPATTSLGATSVQYATNLIAYAGLDSLGVLKSIDGGATWNPANGDGSGGLLTAAGRVELSVALSDATGNTLYASVGAASGGSSLSGFYKTTNGGTTWTKLGPVASPGLVDYCSGQCWYDNVVAVNPVDPDVVFVGGSAVANHISKTTNGGTTWSSATTSIHVDHHAAAFTPDGTRLYWGNDGGVYRTNDATSATPSATWTNLNSMLGITQFYSYFALHPTDINITFGGAQDNGTQRYDGTQDISLAWSNVTCGDGAGNVIDQFNPGIVYANCQNVDVRKSTNGGMSGFAGADTGIDTNDRVTFIPPMVGDSNPNATNFIYFGTHQVYQTRDAAVSWQRISNDVTNGSSSISNMAVAPSDRNVMYVVTRSGRVAKGINLTAAAPNDCATLLNCFTDVTGNLTPASRRINAVAVSPTDSNTVYVGHSGFGSGTQHLSKSTAGGITWTNVTGNLPNTPVNDIVVDPDIPGTLYVGTDIGVFRSTDDGGSWSTLANGLPKVAVYGLKLHRASRTLRAATHGRGFWDLSVPANVVGAGGSLSPSSLSFASRQLSTTSAAQNISFVNNGTAPTTVSNVSASGDFAIASNGCTSPVAATASCNIGVTFTPTVAGSRSGTLTVTSNAVNSPATANLSGLGAPPNDNFANAVVVNSGTFTHTANTLGASSEGADPTGTCDFSSPPHSKSVWYFYTPAGSGQATINTRNSNYDTVLAVFTGTQGAFAEVANGCNDDINNVAESPSEVIINVTGGTTYRIMVSGFAPNDGGTLNFSVTGPAPAAPGGSLTITPTTLTFSGQAIGTTSPSKSFTLTATGGAVNSIAVAAATGDFSRTTSCPASLAQGVSCSVSVTFTPAASGARNGSIAITSTGVGSPQSVALSGTGDTLSLAPTPLTVSAVVGRSSAPQAVTFFNGSGGTATVTNVSVTGDYSQTNDCGAVANGGSCTVNVTFTPAASGARNGTLTVTSSSGVRNATLNGTGVDFSLSLARPVRPGRTGTGSTIVLEPGQSATVDMQIGVTGGSTELVTLGCAGATSGLRCTVEPQQIRAGETPQTVKVKISASARAGRLAAPVPTETQTLMISATVLGVTRSEGLRVEIAGNAGKTPPARARRLGR